MIDEYRKKLSLDNLKHGELDILRIENIILKLGYTKSDYRFNYFNNSVELIVTNQNLYRDIKTIKRIN